MRFVSVVLILVVATMVSSASAIDFSLLSKHPYDIEKADELFELFMKKYQKVYTSEDDKQAHFQVFVENLKKVNQMNEEILKNNDS
ncbi:unnamed protein product [Spodoptera littoralis]|uniref:Cathepsin propeptide inhibitor domain-containing protein n=1 Tax=Spodoptera littoralis TaxID=7109 RepID=A0A9P0ICL4_SPOLI|nr:unnamed protein product [Spodoptera littoralis]CAH1645458.1 unnamed protein product [Spodoptera littoralis]